MSNETENADLSRRKFIKGAMAMGALGSMGAGLLSAGARAAGVPDGKIMTGSHWGAFHANVKNGRVVGLEPWSGDPHPSHQLPGVMDVVYSPTRIRYPMVRRSWLEHGPGADTAGRGAGDFVRVSWDKALDLVAQELKRVRDQHGPRAIFAGSYGWKSPGKLHNCQTLLARAMMANGGFVSRSGDYSTGAAQVILPYVVGSIDVYEQPTAWPVVVEHTELMVFWGADPVVTNQIGWQVPDHGAYPAMESLRKKGTKVICIDPVRTETCQFFGAEWLAPRPQTDVALMLGIAHTLYAENLHDKAFLARYCTGFDRFVPYLTGKNDGVVKDAQWASGICGLPAQTIQDLARRFAGHRTMLAAGWSIQRQHHGEQAHWMLVTLAAMLGQIGTPGGGYGFTYHYANGGSPTATSPVLPGITAGAKPPAGAAWLDAGGSESIPVSRIVEMLENPGGSYDFNGKRETWPDIKLAYWVGGNPFAHHQDRNRMRKAWRKLDTFIVHELQWTATARHADIILPCTSTFERNDIEGIGDYSMSHILAMRKAIDPVFEARNDYDIFTDICQRMGTREAFTEGRDEMAWIRSFYEAARVQARGKRMEMPVFDVFWNSHKPLGFPVSEEAKGYIRHKAFRDDPLLNALGTASGRIEIYSSTIERMHYDDCPPHPTWMEPVERLGGAGRYPLHIVSSHPRARLHSQLCGTVLRKNYAIQEREPCLMNPQDAQARGISNGDVIRVFNDRGQILVGVRLTDDIRPGAIRICEGGWYDPADPRQPGSLCRYGDVNNLTVGIGTSKLAQGNCGHTGMAQAEKYKGALPPLSVFTPPQGAAT
ncbi:trimethylamine-N-oxide reductase TorA [Silvimonas iriomotensis]|uniref:trimethylamine-N-oxide reductase n=1 Tax=Silvimonas iriomotensis TaxID=449662 RepID=A0ABQ2P4Q9_9NEIS|nr:trimethylamine-N-oxide reductase TorA [Silvimonas iriomotensis]GGP17827.1 trimethylamine N-oxide reductase I catalytic subunit [Silvimonas iriomotensis]